MSNVNPIEYFICGGFGGVVTCLVGHPFDTVKVRLQTQPTPAPGEKPQYTGKNNPHPFSVPNPAH